MLKYGQDYDMAIDGDTVCVEVPAQPGKGQHYVVHYWWRGYYDAIDVHTHDFQVPEELKYGNRTNSFVYNKIDHCTYRNPRKILTPIFDATHSVKDCVDAVNAIVPAQESIGIRVVLRDTMDAFCLCSIGYGTSTMRLGTSTTTTATSSFPTTISPSRSITP